MDLLDDDVIDLRPRGRKTDPAAFIEQQRRRSTPVPAENAPLRDWERPQTDSSGEEQPASQPAPPSGALGLGLCQRCGAKPARSRCAQCGQGVCSADAWSMLGLCKACVASNIAAPPA
jgi:hypothetical protein